MASCQISEQLGSLEFGGFLTCQLVKHLLPRRCVLTALYYRIQQPEFTVNFDTSAEWTSCSLSALILCDAPESKGSNRVGRGTWLCLASMSAALRLLMMT